MRFIRSYSNWLDSHSDKVEVPGSSPGLRTTFFWRYRITGLVHRPFKAAIRVRVPLALLHSDVAQLVEQGFRKAQVVSSSLTVGVRKHLAKCPSLRVRPVSFGYRWTGGVMKPAIKW